MIKWALDFFVISTIGVIAWLVIWEIIDLAETERSGRRNKQADIPANNENLEENHPEDHEVV